MSDCIGSSCSRPCGSASRGDKPRHVKSLNFGQSILELDVADQQLGCFVTSSRALVIDQNVAHIPCTEKKDYVRKWIESHENAGPDLSDDLSKLSPVLGTSATKVYKMSPILGSGGKRHSTGTRINRHAVGRSVEQEQNASCTVQWDGGSKDENQNEQEYFQIQYTPPCTETIADGSPVLGTCLYSYKKRRRKSRYGMEDYVSSKRIKLHDDTVTNTHAVKLDNKYDTVSERSVDHNELEEDSDSNVKETAFQIETEESPERLQIPQILSSEDSSNNKSHKNNKVNPKIDTSEESKDEEYNEFSSTNSSTNNSLNNFIEEVDTQDMLPVVKTSQLSAKSLSILGSQSKPSQLVATDTNETYNSEAEMLLNQSTHLSAKISLVPSLTRDVTVSKSTQTPVISTISTPSKVSPDKIMYARLLDSGKKRHKPKKGSMVAKLQSLINTQVSSIRIWRHRMNKKHEAASARFISVLVRDCWMRFGNQFLKGTLIEDRFNLLQSDVETEEAESRNVQAPPRKTLLRDLTIILVCDIVGALKMMSEVVINVHPPWTVLDEVNFTLEAMYVSISHNQEIPNSDPDRNNSRKREKRIVKEFNCPCIEEERELPFCARKPSADKPDVMQQIFDF